jgi:hypothetical protein
MKIDNMRAVNMREVTRLVKRLFGGILPARGASVF